MRVILYGAPGSGKGTQAVMLAQSLDLRKISLGDILREEVKKESSLGQEVKSYMEKGLLVPDELVSRVIEENIDSTGFLLDGYPRNLAQAKKLEEILTKKSTGIDAFVYLFVDEDTIVDRLTKRRICPSCSENYHLENMPPKKEGVCDSCSAELIQRKDDTADVIKKRWEVFSEASEELLDFYKQRNKLIEVDARGDKDEIFEKIKKTLQ